MKKLRIVKKAKTSKVKSWFDDKVYQYLCDHTTKVKSMNQQLDNLRRKNKGPTPEQRVQKAERKLAISQWAKKIKSTGKCDICKGSNNLTAHHLWGKTAHPTLALEPENGVCLCRNCHELFHELSSVISPNQYKKFSQDKHLTHKELAKQLK